MLIQRTIAGATLALLLVGTAQAQPANSPAEPKRTEGEPTKPTTPPNNGNATGNNTPPLSPAQPVAPSASDATAGSASPVNSNANVPPATPVAAVPPTVIATAPVAPASTPEGSNAGTRVNPEAPLETGPVPMKGKWNPVMYGFVEFDAMRDSTQSFNDLAGNGSVASSTSYAGKHERTTFGVRNSRLGFKLTAPESNGIKTSGILEMDFFGNQPSNPPTTSEGAFFASPTFRIRHFAMKLESAYVDVLLGQYWQLFGWQSYFHPNTVEIQGVPGQVYSRSPQARLSHTFKTDPINVELAVAASRPTQRDSGTPDGQGGIRVLINDWKGIHTMGGTGTAADAAAVGVSGVLRRFVVPEYSASPSESHRTFGWGISTDVLLPVIPASMENRSNALTLNGSWVYGRGIADLFTGLTDGSTASGALPNPNNVANPSYTPGIDGGLVELSRNGTFQPIHWQVFMGGVQYYLPPTGHVWVSANYAHMKSNDILNYPDASAKAGLFDKAEWYDANLFWDVTFATRLGAEYAHFKQTYGDDSTRTNHRVQFSGWLIF
jgi:hypothetical protein